jgi:hypothetical protein
LPAFDNEGASVGSTEVRDLEHVAVILDENLLRAVCEHLREHESGAWATRDPEDWNQLASTDRRHIDRAEVGASLFHCETSRPVVGSYMRPLFLGLVVNDGLVNSDVATVSVFNALAPTMFRNKTMGKTLTNELNAIVAMIAHGAYDDALTAMQNDVANKVDGCADGGAPDDNDWIVDCAAQDHIFRVVTTIMDHLGRL